MKILNLTPEKVPKGTVVRTYLPCGVYGAGTFRHPEAIFCASDDLAFSVAKVRNSDSAHHECPWSFPDEIRLLAAVALCANVGMLAAYPAHGMFRLPDGDYDPTDQKLVKAIGEELRSRDDVVRTLSRDATLYVHHARQNYCLRDTDVSFERFASYFDAIDPEDHLTIRGLGALIKGPLLACHYCFHTESCISLHVAMEAGGELIRQRLRADGKNDSYVEAGNFVADAFGVNIRGRRYFEDYYDDRVKAIHPQSRHGAFSDPGLSADDFYDLYHHLIAVYDFLLTGAIRRD